MEEDSLETYTTPSNLCLSVQIQAEASSDRSGSSKDYLAHQTELKVNLLVTSLVMLIAFKNLLLANKISNLR